MMAVRHSKYKMSIIFKNYAWSLAGRFTMWLFKEFVDTPVNGRPSLFRIDSVYQIGLLIIIIIIDWSIGLWSHTKSPFLILK
jgi:hypothetical protein